MALKSQNGPLLKASLGRFRLPQPGVRAAVKLGTVRAIPRKPCAGYLP